MSDSDAIVPLNEAAYKRAKRKAHDDWSKAVDGGMDLFKASSYRRKMTTFHYINNPSHYINNPSVKRAIVAHARKTERMTAEEIRSKP